MSENSMSSNTLSKGYIAVNRFGYGARGDELIQAELNPKAWIKSTLLPVSFNTSLPHSNDIFISHNNYQQQKKQSKNQKKNKQQFVRQ